MEFVLEIKDGACVTNLDDYSDIGTNWIVLNALNVCYFDKFGVENIPKEIKKFIEGSSIN